MTNFLMITSVLNTVGKNSTIIIRIIPGRVKPQPRICNPLGDGYILQHQREQLGLNPDGQDAGSFDYGMNIRCIQGLGALDSGCGVSRMIAAPEWGMRQKTSRNA